MKQSVVAPFYPSKKLASWWIVLGDRDSRQLYVIRSRSLLMVSACGLSNKKKTGFSLTPIHLTRSGNYWRKENSFSALWRAWLFVFDSYPVFGSPGFNRFEAGYTQRLVDFLTFSPRHPLKLRACSIWPQQQKRSEFGKTKLNGKKVRMRWGVRSLIDVRLLMVSVSCLLTPDFISYPLAWQVSTALRWTRITRVPCFSPCHKQMHVSCEWCWSIINWSGGIEVTSRNTRQVSRRHRTNGAPGRYLRSVGIYRQWEECTQMDSMHLFRIYAWRKWRWLWSSYTSICTSRRLWNSFFHR